MDCPICNAPLKRSPRAVSRLIVCEQCGRVVSSVQKPAVQVAAPDTKVVDAQLAPAPIATWGLEDQLRLEAEVSDEAVKPPPACAVPLLSFASLGGAVCWLLFRSPGKMSTLDELGLLGCYELGILFFCAGLFNWKWFWRGRKARNLRRLVGPTIARRFYMAVGAIIYLVSVYSFCFGNG
jgi:hypothetical protein